MGKQDTDDIVPLHDAETLDLPDRSLEGHLDIRATLASMEISPAKMASMTSILQQFETDFHLSMQELGFAVSEAALIDAERYTVMCLAITALVHHTKHIIASGAQKMMQPTQEHIDMLTAQLGCEGGDSCVLDDDHEGTDDLAVGVDPQDLN